MTIIKEIAAQYETIKKWRQELHTIPEIAFQEEKTAQYIEQKLLSFGLTLHPRIAKTGVVASIRCGTSTQSIALRADIDALAIQEQNNFHYCSTHPGFMHACGHDGHSAMLLAAAQYLSLHQNFNGTVYFVFQPAEENEGGARKMIEEGFLKLYPIDSIYGMHNWPNIDVGKFSIRHGPMMAAYDVFDIIIHGKGGHAAAPHQTIDPIVITAQVISALQTITSRQINPLESNVISITKVLAGENYNVIPDTATISGTVRTFQAPIQQEIINKIKQISTAICEGFGASAEINYQPRYPATINHDNETEHAIKAALQIVGKDNVILNSPPSLGSEDFSFFLQQVKGCYISIGNGTTASLHNSHYDFNDEALPIGASYWVKLTQMLLK